MERTSFSYRKYKNVKNTHDWCFYNSSKPQKYISTIFLKSIFEVEMLAKIYLNKYPILHYIIYPIISYFIVIQKYSCGIDTFTYTIYIHSTYLIFFYYYLIPVIILS